MKSAIVPPGFQVRWGPTARDLLAAAPRGRVLAVMSQAVYLECESDELIWLTTRAAPMHGRAVVLEGALPQPTVQAEFRTHESGIAFEGGPSLRWAPAELWQPPPVTDATRAGARDLASRVLPLPIVLEALPASKGFGVLLGPLLEGSLASAAHSPSVADSPILRQALPAIQGMLGAIRDGELDASLTLAEPLLGLGEGLTPSGDDFIGGLLFGFATLHAVDPALTGFSPAALERFQATARDRTNRISHTLLRDHVAGRASEPLHRLFAAILEGESPANLAPHAHAAARIGHSTGWDTLTGLWAALTLLASPGPSRPRG